jgi:hypothetical protein
MWSQQLGVTGCRLRRNRSYRATFFLRGRDKEKQMFKTQSFLIAAMLLASVTAFAGDTPDPSSKGEAALPSGSNAATPPSTPPAGTAAKTGADSKEATTPSPPEEAKGKPPDAPQ